MLRVVPKRLFSWNFKIFHGKELVAALDQYWFRVGGKITIQGCTYEVSEGFIINSYILNKDGNIVASATIEPGFATPFDIVYGESRYTLKHEPWEVIAKKWVLYEGNRIIGSIKREHLFIRKTIIDLPEDISLEVQVFMAWLVITPSGGGGNGGGNGGWR